MHPKDAEGMSNGEDPDLTAPSTRNVRIIRIFMVNTHQYHHKITEISSSATSFEPSPDKTNKNYLCAQRRLRSAQSDQRLR